MSSKAFFQRLLVTVTLSLLTAALFAETLVAKTEHFDIIYEEESAGIAKYLYENVEQDYTDLVAFFHRDPELHVPVYITRQWKNFNGYATLYPYSRICLFDTIPDYDVGLSNAENTLNFVFRHELTHIFSMNMRGKFLEFVSDVFGDPVSMTELTEFQSFVEGIAVTFESYNGDGRLHDPLATTIVKQAAIEGKNLSYRDAAGFYNIYPSGNIPYMFGATFLNQVLEDHGTETIGDLFSAYGELRFSTTAHTYRKITGTRLSDAWNDAMAQVAVPTYIQEPYSFTPYGRYAKLTLSEDTVYGMNSYKAQVFALDGRNQEKKVLSNGVSSYIVSVSSQKHFLLGASNDTTELVRLLDEEGKVLHSFKGGREGVIATLDGEEVYVIYRTESQTTCLKLYSSSFEELGTVELGYGVLGGDFTFLEDGKVLFVLSSKGTEHLALLDLATQSLAVSENTLGLEYSSLSGDGKGTATFGYVYKSDMSELSKYGEATLCEDSLAVRLSPINFNGGVYYPVKKSDGTVIHISRFFNGQKLSKTKVEKLKLEEAVLDVLLPWSVVPGPDGLDSFMAASSGYHPFSYMAKGFLLPYMVRSNFGFSPNVTGLGVTYTTIDPTEEHQFSTSFGFDFDAKPIATVNYSYAGLLDIHVTTATPNYGSEDAKILKSTQEVDAQLNLGFPFAPGMGTLKAVETLGYIHLPEESYWMNDFTLSYKNVRQKDMGRHNLFGFGVSASIMDRLNKDFSDLTYILGASLYIPKLLPLRSTPYDTFNLPLAVSGKIAFSGKAIQSFAWDGKLYLYNHEVQKGTKFLWLFMRNVTVFGSATGSYKPASVSTEKGVLSQQYSLSASTILVPTIGQVGSTYACEVGGALTWTPGKGFSLGYIFKYSI